MTPLLTWKKLREDMQACEQTSGQSILEHGRSIWHYYDYLREFLAYGYDDDKVEKIRNTLEWRLPDWYFKYEEDLAWERFSTSTFLYYTEYHDCGKPYCRTVDNEGKVHFPNHAEVSYQTWLKVNEHDRLNPKHYSDEFIEQVGNLIRRDMEIHTLKADGVEEFCRNPREAVSLLLVGLCEIHSNAEMFGGIDSISFKIKWKQINRRGNAICKRLFPDT
jgi:hypothetical protein